MMRGCGGRDGERLMVSLADVVAVLKSDSTSLCS